ncbi:nucleoside hydrolase [Aspergillus puulaauensis]|uniref:Uridine nucleosidase 1 n=1 Tax=Aspergillus puulaauensis TaxID=1220207 RepID=A0A7R7X9Q5_9EURO|nr:uridine nucleosidase 1 [Aspergillus puulaauensis]BCS17432.1 uridine nucleosidase 1 [Aspergillus puulaauensis]
MASSHVPVWLDCDPGHDDAFAILLAAYHPNIKLLGITSVFGNASIENTTHNAAALLTAMGKHNDIPLYIGERKPLDRPALHAPTEIHGASGLDGTDLLPTPLCAPSSEPGVDAMAAALKAQPPGTAWVVATGALTNVGALFRKYPDLVAHVKGLSLMGGAIGAGFSDAPLGKSNVQQQDCAGNWTRWAEFNILVDPEAAADIFHNKEIAKKTIIAPLDLTHQVRATSEVKDLLLFDKGGANGQAGMSTLRRMLVELLYFFSKTYADVFGITDGPPLHDPIAVAAVLADIPGGIPFFQWDATRSQGPQHRERFEVTVITHGRFEEAEQKQTGRTIAKKCPIGEEGVTIPRGLDVPKFWTAIEDCLERADEANKAFESRERARF